MGFSKIGVLGAGQMGSGIAQVSLMSGLQVVLNDVSEAVLARSRAGIGKGLDILVRKEKITAQEKERALSGLQTTIDPRAGSGEDRLGHVVQDDLQAAHQGDLRDPAPHLTGPEDADLRNAHRIPQGNRVLSIS